MTRYQAIMRELMTQPMTIDGTLAPGHPWHLGTPLAIRQVETSAIRYHARMCGRQAGEMARAAAYADARVNSQ